MAGAGLPALTALGWRFWPEEGGLHPQSPSSKGIWQSWLGKAKSLPNWRSYPLETLNAQEACTPQAGAMVTCCVTSGKFYHLSGP